MTRPTRSFKAALKQARTTSASHDQESPVNPLSFLSSIPEGVRIPGGCDDCDAYQTVDSDQDSPNVMVVHVHHDDWCPFFLARSSS